MSDFNESCEFNECFPNVGLTCNSSKKCVYAFNVNTSILTINEIVKLYELSGLSSNRILKLLDRATLDGFNYTSFHGKCDGYPNTFTVIKSEHNYVYGGFTKQIWNDTCGLCSKNDSNAFIFSLRRNVTGFDVSVDACRLNVTVSQDAVYVRTDFGPLFGAGYDIGTFFILHGYNGWSLLGKSYQIPNGYLFASLEASSFLGGSSLYDGQYCYFNIVEVEVFSLI